MMTGVMEPDQLELELGTGSSLELRVRKRSVETFKILAFPVADL
ncbi:hypothetical protein [Metallosphaera tengchongensis]|nr:hypothetical protein [Metallosphaera tengchongensis]